MRQLAAGLLSSLLVLAVASPASAIPDEEPPLVNWTETWIMPNSVGPISVEFLSGSDEWDLFPITPTVQAGFDCDEPCDPTGTVLEITLPNFVDPLPKKLIEVLFEGGNAEPSSLPSVLEVIGFDTPFGSDQTEPDVIAGIPSPSLFEGTSTDTGFLWKEVWKIFPNPDKEIIRVFIPFDFEWVKLHVTTQSLGTPVPEPSALVLVGSGLLGLLVMGRRRA